MLTFLCIWTEYQTLEAEWPYNHVQYPDPERCTAFDQHNTLTRPIQNKQHDLSKNRQHQPNWNQQLTFGFNSQHQIITDPTYFPITAYVLCMTHTVCACYSKETNCLSLYFFNFSGWCHQSCFNLSQRVLIALQTPLRLNLEQKRLFCIYETVFKISF